MTEFATCTVRLNHVCFRSGPSKSEFSLSNDRDLLAKDSVRADSSTQNGVQLGSTSVKELDSLLAVSECCCRILKLETLWVRSIRLRSKEIC